MDYYKAKLKNIKAFAFDVDGVMTNGQIICDPQTGDLIRSYNAKDGLGMRMAFMKGYTLAIITGGESESIRKRFYPTLVNEVIMAARDKLPVFQEFAKRYNLTSDEVAYVGDDLPDIPVLQHCGLSVCPADAVEEVKAVCDYISPYGGGRGCVRELIEQVLKIQGHWDFNAAYYQEWRAKRTEEFNKLYNNK